MAEELFTTLMRYHREVVMPDMEALVFEGIRVHRNETLEGFDGIYEKLETLQIEYHTLNSALRRVEGRVTDIENRMATKEDIDKLALRSELVELSGRVDEIEQRVGEIETKR